MSHKPLITFMLATSLLALGLVSGGELRLALAQQNPHLNPPSGITFTGGSGESLEKAIIIKGAKDSSAGIAAEYQYLDQKIGKRNADWKLIRQGLLHKDGRHFDLMEIQLKDGSQKVIYFDISDFFGKL